MVLFEKFRILHRDVSINNTMIYVADIPESEGNEREVGSDEASNAGDPEGDGGLHCSEALRNEAVDSQGDKIAQWDQERLQQIRAGLLHSGLLIDFDYATDLDQAPSSMSGDCTVRISPFFPILSDKVSSREQSRSCQPTSFSTIRRGVNTHRQR